MEAQTCCHCPYS